MWNLNYDTNEPISETETDSQISSETMQVRRQWSVFKALKEKYPEISMCRLTVYRRIKKMQ